MATCITEECVTCYALFNFNRTYTMKITCNFLLARITKFSAFYPVICLNRYLKKYLTWLCKMCHHSINIQNKSKATSSFVADSFRKKKSLKRYQMIKCTSCVCPLLTRQRPQLNDIIIQWQIHCHVCKLFGFWFQTLMHHLLLNVCDNTEHIGYCLTAKSI